MREILLAGALAISAGPGGAEGIAYDATLAGHAVLPARTLMPAPADAPAALQTSGKFAGAGNRRSAAPATDGSAPPFAGQPLQGFSAIGALGDGNYLVLTDNGFGTRRNSPDAMLFLSLLRPDFPTGTVELRGTVFLNDSDAVVPFPIAMEGSASRYLTGADFDPESLRIVGERIVIGDEFGPFVVVADLATGRVAEVHETAVDGRAVRSPDNPFLGLADPHAAPPGPNLRRSKGFEGLAASVDGKTLYALLEGPLWTGDAYETAEDGRIALRILEMAAETREWTGRSWVYPLESPDHAIGDFSMIDETRGLVIERDDGQGDAALACKTGETEGCFTNPAAFKRVYMIDMAGVGPGLPVRKLAHIDLLDIRDPDGVARQGRRDDGRFGFPFVTIESVERIDETHIIVVNDNNFPFSSGRQPGRPDDNEFILLEVGEFLKAGTR